MSNIQVVINVHFTENGYRPGIPDCVGYGYECNGRTNHFITRFYTGYQQGEMQSGSTIRDSDSIGCTDILGEVFFKLPDARALGYPSGENGIIGIMRFTLIQIGLGDRDFHDLMIKKNTNLKAFL